MELKQLATKPKLHKITVDNDTVVEAYGEPVEFYMWDRQDLPTYLRLAQIKEDQNELFDIIKDLVLDAKGNKVLNEGEMLPLEIMVPVLESAVAHLGNEIPQTSQQ